MTRKKGGLKPKTTVPWSSIPMARVAPKTATREVNTSNKEIAECGEHITENLNASESSISKTPSLSDIKNPENQGDLIDNQILENDRGINKCDISKN